MQGNGIAMQLLDDPGIVTRCDECGKDHSRCVEFDRKDEPGNEVCVCPACLFKALAMFRSCAQCCHFQQGHGDRLSRCVTHDENGPRFLTFVTGANPAEFTCSYEPSRFELKGPTR
jgi:hypothetical protein